jgi:hypothetical protein
MVPSYTLVVSTDGQRMPCGGFSLGETIRFGRLVFIADYFGSLSLTLRRSHLDAAFTGSTRSGP